MRAVLPFLRTTSRCYQSLSSHSCDNPNNLPLSLPHLDALPLNSTSHQASSQINDPDKRPKEREISDQEWEIRTGRAIYVLRQTLPAFFNTGLIGTGSHNGDAKVNDIFTPHEPIYSPKVRLCYRPGGGLLSGMGDRLHIEGLPLYTASSVFIRHTMNAIYSDLEVEMTKVVVDSSSSALTSSSGVGWKEGVEGRDGKERRHRREKSLYIGLRVLGKTRVSGSTGEWDVNSTYAFNPQSGLIHMHTINSILPAPHQAVFDALGRFFKVGHTEPVAATVAAFGRQVGSIQVDERKK